MLGNPGWYFFFSKNMCNLPWYWTRKRYVCVSFPNAAEIVKMGGVKSWIFVSEPC